MTFGAHHMAAERSVTHHEAGIDAQVAFERLQVVREGAPVPGHSLLQRLKRHALDSGQHAREVVGVLRCQWGEGEPTVAAEDRCYTVKWRRGGVGVPEELGVVVRVDVDHARRHDETGGVDDEVGFLAAQIGDRHDTSTVDADIGPPRWGAGAIDDLTTPNDAPHLAPPLRRHIISAAGGPPGGTLPRLPSGSLSGHAAVAETPG